MSAPKMTRAHFELVAAAMRESRPCSYETDSNTSGAAREQAQWANDVSRLAAALAATNGQFQRERFLRACGVQP